MCPARAQIDDARVAARAWAHLLDVETSGANAVETLDTYVAHASSDASGRLLELVRHDERDNVRAHAVHAASKLGRVGDLRELLDILEQPPAVTWSVHIALLDACRTHALAPRGLDALRDVDRLDVQSALASL
ncbi:hypothetical protein DB32_007473 [Sandaracinus amylolyticus]|uniref:HEAT repeat domain-containing protein n=1 Tax=Sandaracinus amylolyticus TaxID=927083 RepID=A0A0F6SHE9_9BACT|nr:hypothetical protein DB32_007473 [Sandaracinus amylolyticus]